MTPGKFKIQMEIKDKHGGGIHTKRYERLDTICDTLGAMVENIRNTAAQTDPDTVAIRIERM